MQTVDDKKGKKLSQKEEASADKEGNHRDQTKKNETNFVSCLGSS